MEDNDRQPMSKTQQTQPKGIDPRTGKPYEPIEIPVPRRGVFDGLLKRAENTPRKDLTSYFSSPAALRASSCVR